MSKTELLNRIRGESRKIREGERAMVRRDNLLLRAREERDDVSFEELAKATGVSVYAVKFALARRRKAAKA